MASEAARVKDQVVAVQAATILHRSTENTAERTMATVHSPPVSQVPDTLGRFGRFGGRYVPETLSAALDQLERAYDEAIADPAFAA